ncbi:hypothetical protein [Cryobacterium sp. TMT3-29-2]|uniref:hypothetical protein n=1 Tax=Cryobacterium sp. TMT3-29-2 TaxID=2555867 RepID=UPI001073FB5D|nr:hypothetical protein [Cryobacterium sp. TMT3-29-2]TFC82421.1 hypothetical protein E3O67_16645 [Cryobacterium sp. TMT3-29-2]
MDQAQAEGWSLTHTLERLLSIEVTATDTRRLSGRFRFANLPTGATLSSRCSTRFGGSEWPRASRVTFAVLSG